MSARDVLRLTIYSRPGCHLCDDMKALVAARASGRALVEEIDITTDPELERLYGMEIPVLLANGRKVAKYRITDDQLSRILDADRS